MQSAIAGLGELEIDKTSEDELSVKKALTRKND
jgi:hypothetical protein